MKTWQSQKQIDSATLATIKQVEKFTIKMLIWLKQNFALHQKGEKYYPLINSVLWEANVPTILYTEIELVEIFKTKYYG